jgi:hypothetical protein
MRDTVASPRTTKQQLDEEPTKVSNELEMHAP